VPDGSSNRMVWPEFVGHDVEKLEKIANQVLEFLRADKQRYTTTMKLVDQASGLLKPVSPDFITAALQLKSRIQVIISQGLTHMIMLAAEQGLIQLETEQLVMALKKATDEKAARMQEFLIRRTHEDGGTLTLTGLASVIYDSSDPNFEYYRKRAKRHILEPMASLGLWTYKPPITNGEGYIIGMGLILDVFLQQVFEPLAREMLEMTARSHRA
jgi:hypothetical protein